MKWIFLGFVLLGCVVAVAAQAQTTAGYYRTCKNYNPDYQEVYENVDSSNYNEKSAALNQYLRDSGCRKQIIRAIEVVKDQKKQCKVIRHPDYDTYQRELIDLLGAQAFQSDLAMMNTSIEMVAPEVMKHILKCF